MENSVGGGISFVPCVPMDRIWYVFTFKIPFILTYIFFQKSSVK